MQLAQELIERGVEVSRNTAATLLPIERRLFSQVERAWSGVMLGSAETALKAVENIQTRTGLQVTIWLLEKVDEIGRKCSDTFREINDQFIRHDDLLRQ